MAVAEDVSAAGGGAAAVTAGVADEGASLATSSMGSVGSVSLSMTNPEGDRFKG